MPYKHHFRKKRCKRREQREKRSETFVSVATSATERPGCTEYDESGASVPDAIKLAS